MLLTRRKHEKMSKEKIHKSDKLQVKKRLQEYIVENNF